MISCPKDKREIKLPGSVDRPTVELNVRRGDCTEGNKIRRINFYFLSPSDLRSL